MRRSRRCRIPHSTGGDCKNHLLIWDKCMEGMIELGEDGEFR